MCNIFVFIQFEWRKKSVHRTCAESNKIFHHFMAKNSVYSSTILHVRPEFYKTLTVTLTTFFSSRSFSNLERNEFSRFVNLNVHRIEPRTSCNICMVFDVLYVNPVPSNHLKCRAFDMIRFAVPPIWLETKKQKLYSIVEMFRVDWQGHVFMSNEKNTQNSDKTNF